MKKHIALTLVFLLILSLLTACSKKSEDSQSSNPKNSKSEVSAPSGSGSSSSSSSSKSTFKYGRADEYIQEHLTGDFSITYQYSMKDSESVLESTITRTSEGYYLKMIEWDCILIRNGDTYDTYDAYYVNGDKGFQKADFADPVPEEEVQKMLWSLGNFMVQYKQISASDLEPDGTEMVAGRNCDKFNTGETNVYLAYKLSYWIDQETGVCMKFAYDLAANKEIVGMTFECVEFITNGVSLPAYS